MIRQGQKRKSGTKSMSPRATSSDEQHGYKVRCACCGTTLVARADGQATDLGVLDQRFKCRIERLCTVFAQLFRGSSKLLVVPTEGLNGVGS
jgi:hypothetical protein